MVGKLGRMDDGLWFITPDGLLVELDDRQVCERHYQLEPLPVRASRRLVLPEPAFTAFFEQTFPVQVVTAPDQVDTSEAARLLGIDRGTLDTMLARAPRTLPGAPVQVGEGRARRHWRWDPSRLAEWREAFGRWDATEAERRATKPAPRRRGPKPAPAPTRGTSLFARVTRGE
jgi:hypothetical protein